jgi:hypothetical protein
VQGPHRSEQMQKMVFSITKWCSKAGLGDLLKKKNPKDLATLNLVDWYLVESLFKSICNLKKH